MNDFEDIKEGDKFMKLENKDFIFKCLNLLKQH